MEAISAGTEADALTAEEEIHCHKARIFSVLTRAPVVRGWKSAICDGAVYLGKGFFPKSYADRYLGTSSKDISYVTFSIVTAFKEAAFDAEGREFERSQCYISPAQREASEFLIVTFSDDHDRIALLPHRLYWPVESAVDEISASTLFDDEISASTLFDYSFSIKLLLANIDEVKRSALNPMHPTTTPFLIGLDRRIPKADTPEAIMAQAPGPHMTALDQLQQSSEKLEQETLRTFQSACRKWRPAMSIDFLDYQPLLRDFKIVVSSGENFPKGLEAVISHSAGCLNLPKDNDDNYHLKHADYVFSHSITIQPNDAAFFPRRLLPDAWFTTPNPQESRRLKLRDSVSKEEFFFNMDKKGRWVKDIWDIICKYPPGEDPTPAEKKQEIWKKAFPWPEIEAQIAIEKESMPQKARRDKGQSFEHGPGMGDSGALEPSDVSLLATHYKKKVSLDHNEAGDDAT